MSAILNKVSAIEAMGLSTRDLGYGSDADRGPGAKDHFASTRLHGSDLRAVLRDSVWDLVQQCSLCAVWSSRETTLNPDRGSGSSESGFSARVESHILMMLEHFLRRETTINIAVTMEDLPCFLETIRILKHGDGVNKKKKKKWRVTPIGFQVHKSHQYRG